MPDSTEVRRLTAKWEMGTGWPKRLQSLEIRGLRGWTGQRFSLPYPIMALVGENGAGKSTVLQCAAAVYESHPPAYRRGYASDFFPQTAWDHLDGVAIRYTVREKDTEHSASVRKPGERWLGNPQRRKRHVEYIDLSRIQPVPARVGYMKLANPANEETTSTPFEGTRLARLSGIMGRHYDLAKMALTREDAKRPVPVIEHQGQTYSGFHQGAGETTITELLERDLPPYSLILIDEIESSLHPRAQRRLIRDLADRCRENEVQIVLTTHSPYVLEELPEKARAYIMQSPSGTREIVYGVSPDFAMTKMDDVAHTECDLYVEDRRSATMLEEILIAADPENVLKCQTVPYGAASVGQALGQMIINDRFPRKSCVFLDGDQARADGCRNLPGNDAPERVVFGDLRGREWQGLAARTGRLHSQIADACNQAMGLPGHRTWIDYAASRLTMSGETLWRAMCAEWANNALPAEDAKAIAQPVADVLLGIKPYTAVVQPDAPSPPPVIPEPMPEPVVSPPEASAPIGQEKLFGRLPDAAQE